jgi:hypothetical protein
MFLSIINSLSEILAVKRMQNVNGVKAVKPLQGSPINSVTIKKIIYASIQETYQFGEHKTSGLREEIEEI